MSCSLQNDVVISIGDSHLKVRVINGYPAILDELNDPGLRQRVEICAEEQLHRLRSSLLVARSEAVAEVLHDLAQLLHQHHALDQLDITELRVPVDVGRADQNWLCHILCNQDETKINPL